MKIESFFTELKRRNVYKVAVAYIVAGWALSQGIAQVLPVFDVPNWVIRLIVLLIIIGLPAALSLAWAFELTPEGIKRTDAADAVGQHSPGHTWIYIVVIAAAFSISLFFLGRFSAGNKTASAAAISNKSIAVLPFENLSRDPENAYFADGIQDEVLSMVAKIGDLKVISRTSTAKYKSRPESLRQVGQELGVVNLLEGSVQKAGDRIRVIVQLIDAGSDNHVWSETYDRELKDVFSVQSEIAQSIATALKAKLSPGETHALGESPTRDPEAYQAYLKAGYFQREATSRNGDPAILLPQALDLYSAAVTKDPSFALAWAQMSYTHSWMHWFGVDESPEQVRLADEAAKRALTLNPELGEAHLAAGYVAYWGKRDYAMGMKEFEVARKLLPNNPDVSIAIGSVCRRRGEWATAIEEFKRAASLDPRDARTVERVWLPAWLLQALQGSIASDGTCSHHPAGSLGCAVWKCDDRACPQRRNCAGERIHGAGASQCRSSRTGPLCPLQNCPAHARFCQGRGSARRSAGLDSNRSRAQACRDGRAAWRAHWKRWVILSPRTGSSKQRFGYSRRNERRTQRAFDSRCPRSRLCRNGSKK